MRQFENTYQIAKSLPGVVSRDLRCKDTGRDYTISVAVPSCYGKKKRKKYPVLLVLDASAILGTAIESTRCMAGIGEIAPCIVVGLGMPDGVDELVLGWRRLWEFSPPVTDWERDDPFGEIFTNIADRAGVALPDVPGKMGIADSLLRFVSAQLLPLIHEDYRTNENDVALFGHSAGGTFALYALLNNLPGIQHFICGSPGLALSGGALSKQLAGMSRSDLVLLTGKSLFLSLGEDEYDNAFNRLCGITDTEQFYLALRAVAPEEFDIQYRRISGAGHATAMSVALMNGVRAVWDTGKAYGDEMPTFARPVVSNCISMLRPFFKLFHLRRSDEPDSSILASTIMGRDFSVQVSLPASYQHEPTKAYPVLIALDASLSFATVAEAVSILATTGELEEAIVVGLGVPRREGDFAFGLRRLEEFSPPNEVLAGDDDLGRIFKSLFALGGKSAHRSLGKADQFHRMICDELLPSLKAEFRVDEGRLAIHGHSAGGTYVAYEAGTEDSPFQSYICSSPGLAISDSCLLSDKNIEAVRRKKGVKMQLVTGEFEHDNYFNCVAGIQHTPDYAKSLQRNGEIEIRYIDFENETHTSVLPRMTGNTVAQLWPTGRPYGVEYGYTEGARELERTDV